MTHKTATGNVEPDPKPTHVGEKTIDTTKENKSDDKKSDDK